MESLMMDFPLTLQHAFNRAVRLFSKKEIVTQTDSGLHRYTFQEWGKRTLQLANALNRAGVKEGDRIATFGWNTYRHLELYFAIPCLGAVLHTLNIRLFAEQLVYIINNAEDSMIFVDGDLVPILEGLADQLKTVKQYVVMGDAPNATGKLQPSIDYETFIAGQPEHFDWPQLDENAAAAMCYTSGTTGNPKGVVYSHRSIFLHSMGVGLADGAGLSEQDTVLPVVPMFHANAWGFPHAVIMMGSKLILPAVEFRVVNIETGQEVPWDNTSYGELQVRGPWIARAYYHDNESSAKFAEGWLRTGDVAVVDEDGIIQLVDRTKDLVKSGGEWISSVELESLIMGHPKVLEACVIGVPHPKWDERPLAFVVAKPDYAGQITKDEIIEYLSPHVAKWWLPDDVVFIDAIPKTSVGKFDKKVLRGQHAMHSGA